MPPGRSLLPSTRPAGPRGPAQQGPTPAFGAGSNSARAEQLRAEQLRPGRVGANAGNAALAESLALGTTNAPQGAAAQGPATPQGAAAQSGDQAANTQAADTPAWAKRPHVGGTLKEGATGAGVEALQRALGVPVTGTFDAATTKAVKAFQEKNGLTPDGIAGRGTLTKLGLRDELRSAHHDADAFIPKYRATAYSESDMYRKKGDPYAVGAITRPDQEDDDGGKTYGTYQFESYVYADGSKKSDKAVGGSTLMRFVNWPDNPYGTKLKEAAKDGVATDAFDKVWKELTTKENKAFGQAQERFLEHDVGEKVKAFFDAAKVPEALRKDDDLYDVAIGTVNQYGGLANGMAADLAAKIATMKSPTADQVGAALQDIKRGKVQSHFKSSPNAWGGIEARIDREKRMFSEGN